MSKLLIVVLVAILAFVLKTLFDANVFTTLEYFSKLSNCTNVVDKGSVENMAVIKTGKHKGIAFFPSSDLTHYLTKSTINYPPSIYSMNLNNKESTSLERVEVIGASIADMNVFHGSDCIVIGDQVYVFLVSHHPGHDEDELSHGEYVNIFEYKHSKLYFRESITSPRWTSINDVAAIGQREFYVSVDHHFPRYLDLYQRGEEILQWKGGSIEYFNGKSNTSTQVASGMLYPNGITFNNDKSKLFVASSLAQQVSVFVREANGNLTPQKPLVLDTFVDNLYVDEDNTLWIAGFPKVLHFVLSVKDLAPSPVSIIQVKEKKSGEKEYEIQKIHVSNGTDVSGMSTVVRYQNRIIASSANHANIMFCNL